MEIQTVLSTPLVRILFFSFSFYAQFTCRPYCSSPVFTCIECSSVYIDLIICSLCQNLYLFFQLIFIYFYTSCVKLTYILSGFEPVQILTLRFESYPCNLWCFSLQISESLKDNTRIPFLNYWYNYDIISMSLFAFCLLILYIAHIFYVYLFSNGWLLCTHYIITPCKWYNQFMCVLLKCNVV